MSEKSPLREEIEALLLKYPRGLTAAEITDRLTTEIAEVRRVLSKLHSRHQIRSTDPNKVNTRYYWYHEEMSVASVNTINRMDGDYEPSIHNPPMPGRPRQDDHYRYGSRMGDWIHFRDGTKKHISET